MNHRKYLVEIRHLAVTATGYGATIPEALRAAEQQWKTAVANSAQTGLLDARYKKVELTLFGGSRYYGDAVKADLVKGKAAIRWSPVVMEAMQHQELIARTVFMVHDGGLGASYGRRKRHRQLGGRRVCTRHYAAQRTRRETRRGVEIIERCSCGARRVVTIDGWEEVYGPWET